VKIVENASILNHPLVCDAPSFPLSSARITIGTAVTQTVLLEVPTRVLPCLAAASGVGVAPESGAADKGADQMGAASAVSPLRLADFLTDSYRMGAFCVGF
jgi:hypothetical protein